MIFNPRDGGRLVLPVDDGSLVIDVKSARVAHQTSSMGSEDTSKTVIKMECDLVGTLVHKDTQEDKTEAIILHGEKDSPEAVVLVTSNNLTDVNVSINYPGVTEITVEACGLPIQYSKMVEMALQEKSGKKKPVGPSNTSMGLLHHSLLSANGYVTPTGQTLKDALGNMVGYTITADQLPGITKGSVIRPSPLQSTKVWPRILTDEEILNDQED